MFNTLYIDHSDVARAVEHSMPLIPCPLPFICVANSRNKPVADVRAAARHAVYRLLKVAGRARISLHTQDGTSVSQAETLPFPGPTGETV